MFGRRARQSVSQEPAPGLGLPGLEDIAGVSYAGSVPIVTVGLILLLSLIYAVETYFSRGMGRAAFAVGDLVRFGGDNAELVLAKHEYWRMFTAPLLHGSALHLIGNCLALLFAGRYLERILGPGWFYAAFVLGGVGGAIASFNLNAPQVVSVGASGGIMGLFAMTILLAYREENEVRSIRMMDWTARIMLPSLLPLAARGHVNYAAHFGGAIAGLLLYLVLTTWWDDNEAQPPFGHIAGGVAASSLMFAAYGFAFGGT